MRSQGKIGKKWMQLRTEWVRENPGPWTCYICGIFLTAEGLTLDHVKSRTRHPELRFDKSNLKPACYSCNQKKGSRDIEEIEDGRY